MALAALVGLALVDQAPGQPLRQAQVSIDALEQDRAAIRTGVGRVEAGNDRPCEPLAWTVTCAIHRFSSTLEGLRWLFRLIVQEFPG